MKSKRPEDWTAEKKLKAIVEYENLDEEQRGKYLREKGLHSVHLERWQQEFVEAYASRKKKTRGGDPRQKRIKELEGDLRRKDKALAETAALLVLKKKVLLGIPGKGLREPMDPGYIGIKNHRRPGQG